MPVWFLRLKTFEGGGVYRRVLMAKNVDFSSKKLILNFVLPLVVVHFEHVFCHVKIAPSGKILEYV